MVLVRISFSGVMAGSSAVYAAFKRVGLVNRMPRYWGEHY